MSCKRARKDYGQEGSDRDHAPPAPGGLHGEEVTVPGSGRVSVRSFLKRRCREQPKKQQPTSGTGEHLHVHDQGLRATQGIPSHYLGH
jgi:hypothetical protein